MSAAAREKRVEATPRESYSLTRRAQTGVSRPRMLPEQFETIAWACLKTGQGGCSVRWDTFKVTQAKQKMPSVLSALRY